MTSYASRYFIGSALLLLASHAFSAGQPIRNDQFGTEAVTLHSCVASGDCSTELDLNLDGNTDLVTGNGQSAQRIRVYLGRGNGDFDPAFTIQGSSRTSGLAFADLEGDGDLDLVESVRLSENNIRVNEGTANNPVFVTTQAISADTDRSSSVALGDFDLDGDIDVAVSNEFAAGSFQSNKVYLNVSTPVTGPIAFDPAIELDPVGDADYSRRMVAIDIEGDGDLDLVAANDGQTPNDNRLYINRTVDNAGVFSFDPPVNLTVALGDDGELTESLAVGDLDGDLDLDIVAANWLSPHRYYLNNGAGNFDTTGTFGLSAETSNVVLSDVDLDGNLDAVMTVERAPNRLHLNLDNPATPSVIEFDGGTDIVEPSIGATNDSRGIDLANLNADLAGYPDLVIGNRGVVPDLEFNFRYLNNECAPAPCQPFANIVPTIDAQVVDPLVTDEETPLDLGADDVTITDGDNIDGDHGIIVLPPDDPADTYTVVDTTITPDPNFFGPLSVDVRVTDLEDESATFALNVTVNPIEDAPVFTSVPITDAMQGMAYNYVITIEDGDGDTPLTISEGPSFPTWLTLGNLTDNGDGTASATLTGMPAGSDVGDHLVDLLASDDPATPDPDQTGQSFTITVASNNSPTVTLNGDAVMAIQVGGTFTDPGATATDPEDGALPVTVGGDVVDTSTIGTYVVTYTATDSDGNSDVAERTVNVQSAPPPPNNPPTVTLNGSASITITRGGTFTDPGATATDPEDGTLAVTVGGDTVDTNTVGVYTVTYTATDSDGSSAQAERTVTVRAPAAQPAAGGGGSGGSTGPADLALLSLLALLAANVRRRRHSGSALRAKS